jgi:hypothetical protein
MDLRQEVQRLRIAVQEMLEDDAIDLEEAAELVQSAADILQQLIWLAARKARCLHSPRRDIQCDRSATCS